MTALRDRSSPLVQSWKWGMVVLNLRSESLVKPGEFFSPAHFGVRYGFIDVLTVEESVLEPEDLFHRSRIPRS
jgi:hypothetical protein